MSNDVVRAVTQGPGIASAAIGAPVPGNLYWAPFGRIDRRTANVLASAGVTDLILSADALPPTDQTQSSEGLATAALPTSVGHHPRRARRSRALRHPDPAAADDVGRDRRPPAVPGRDGPDRVELPADQASRTVVVAPHGRALEPVDARWSPRCCAPRERPPGWPRRPSPTAARRTAVLGQPAARGLRRQGQGGRADPVVHGEQSGGRPQQLDCLHVDRRRPDRA